MNAGRYFSLRSWGSSSGEFFPHCASLPNNVGGGTMSCTEQCRAMAFAQPTWHEVLPGFEASFPANATELEKTGFHSPANRSTLADANGSGDWRIYAGLAALLTTAGAHTFYLGQALACGPENRSLH